MENTIKKIKNTEKMLKELEESGKLLTVSFCD